MARTRSLAQLRDDVLKRADRENAGLRFPAPEVNEYVNQSIADLYDQIVAARGRAYFATSDVIACDGTTVTFSLPSDFYELLSVRLDFNTVPGSGAGASPVANGPSIELEPFNELEEARLLSPATSICGAAYGFRGGNIDILPVQSTGKGVVIKYISASARLVADSDTFDGYGGWEEFIILDAARKIATKDERWQLVSSLKDDIALIRTRIAAMAGKRDRGRPERVQDVRGMRRGRFGRRWP